MVVEPVAHFFFALGLLDRRQHTMDPRGHAAGTQRIDRRELGVAEARGAQCTGGVFRFFETLVEQRGTPFDGRGRIVQLVGEPGGELSERHQLFVVKVL